MSVHERSASNATIKNRNKLFFRPRRRLRHLQGVEAFRLGTDPDSLLHYKIHCLETSETIESEKVPCSRHVEWEFLDFSSLNLSPSSLHGYRSGLFEIIIFSSYKSSKQEESFIVLRMNIDLNQVISVRKTKDLKGVCFRLENVLHYMPTITGTFPTQLDMFIQLPNLNELPVTTESRSDGSDYSHSQQAGSSNDGRDTWTQGERGVKLYNTMERRADIKRLSATHNTLKELVDRRQKLHLYLSRLLKERLSRAQDIQKLNRLKQSANEKGVQAVNIEFRLSAILQDWEYKRREKLETIEFSHTACMKLKEELTRLTESADSLSQQIISKSDYLHRRLVARRCNLVASIASCFGLRPYDVSFVSSGSAEIETIVDKQWWRSKTPTTMLTHSQTSITQKRPQSAVEYNKRRTYLGIVGLELAPKIVAMIETGLVEWSLTQAQKETIEAAFYYVASIVTLCSFYLDFPLRYPTHLLGSRTLIIIPSTSKASAPSSSKDWNQNQGPQQFPLFFQGSGGPAKRKLAQGFTLLDRNIQQLLATHGVKSNDRSYLLQNLDALVSASRSGIGSKRDP